MSVATTKPGIQARTELSLFHFSVQGLVHCASLRERNLLADVSTLVERHRAAGARKRDLLRLLAASLLAMGHDAALCLSRWDKSSSHPAGEHAYVDVLLPAGSDRGDRERVIVDVDFRSLFEVARPTKAYRAVLQRLPSVFVGREDRLRLLVAAAVAVGWRRSMAAEKVGGGVEGRRTLGRGGGGA